MLLKAFKDLLYNVCNPTYLGLSLHSLRQNEMSDKCPSLYGFKFPSKLASLKICVFNMMLFGLRPIFPKSKMYQNHQMFQIYCMIFLLPIWNWNLATSVSAPSFSLISEPMVLLLDCDRMHSPTSNNIIQTLLTFYSMNRF